MIDRKKELNHVINMMYRQLGKMVSDDLEIGKINIKKYRTYKKQIENVKQARRLLEIQMDGLEEDRAVVRAPEQDEQGLYLYKFCTECQAGNNPESTHCIRCHNPLT